MIVPKPGIEPRTFGSEVSRTKEFNYTIVISYTYIVQNILQMEKSHVNFQLEVKLPAEFHHYFTTKSNPICIPQQCYQQFFALIDRNCVIC